MTLAIWIITVSFLGDVTLLGMISSLTVNLVGHITYFPDAVQSHYPHSPEAESLLLRPPLLRPYITCSVTGLLHHNYVHSSDVFGWYMDSHKA